MKEKSPIDLIAGDAQSGLRLDQALAQLVPDVSRSRLTVWIKAERVTVDGQIRRPRDRIFGGEHIRLVPDTAPVTRCKAEPIPLDLVFEDEHILVINKPAGLVVHPAAGNPDGTLQNALLNFDADLDQIPRSGIVHRLDKETSGLLVIARTLAAHKGLVDQLQTRAMGREYFALACGVLVGGGTIDQPVGRHPVDRKRMAVVRNGKEAVTHYRIAERFAAHTLLRVKLETGRTHQIRVHMAWKRHPLVGDQVYGGRLRLPAGASPELVQAIRNFRRQALHAAQLKLIHPVSNESVSWKVDLPDDFSGLLEYLRDSEQQEDDD